ncbi:MAG TPA: 3-hydroxyacyl-CoA dehydrogenase [Burkholderiales bacterium]
MKDFQKDSLTIGVAGTGAMGRGIAQIAVQGGAQVLLYDAMEGAAQKAKDYISAMLAKLGEKGKLTAEQVTGANGRLRVAAKAEELAPCDLVVEAIVENLSVKKEFFQKLEAITREDAILATNTSSLSVTSIAAACKRPERVAGYHFFNPVPLMRIVEVVAGTRTNPAVCDALTVLAKRMGHTAVSAQDTPGFIVNHAGRGYGTEALRILGEGVAEFHQVDRIMTDAAGFRLGPLELLDLTGMDVSHPVMESIYHQYYEEPKYKPSVIGQQRKDAGLLGRKTGRGFYNHADGKQEVFPDPPAPARPDIPVWVSKACPEGHAIATDLLAQLGVATEYGTVPTGDALIVLTPLGTDATNAALDEGVDPTRSVALDTLLPLLKRRTVMSTPVTRAEFRAAAHGLFSADGVPTTMIRDSAGFVAQRILAMIVNIGCDIAQQRVCSPADLDLAVTLGLSYPKGPLAFGDALGARKILDILRNINSLTGDPRYRPSPWLIRRARLGVSLLTPD